MCYEEAGVCLNLVPSHTPFGGSFNSFPLFSYLQFYTQTLNLLQFYR